MSEAADTIYTAATSDLERLIDELRAAYGDLDWSAVRAKAEAIAVLVPLIETATNFIGEEEAA